MSHYNVRIKTFPNGCKQYTFYTEYYSKNTQSPNTEYKVPGLEQTKNRSLLSLKSSVKRSKTNLFDIARSNNWTYFITLTFSPTVCNRYDYNACCSEMMKFTNWLCKRHIKYLLVAEQHKDGAWHFHGLVDNKLSVVDSGLKDHNNIIYNIPAYKFGFTTATQIRDQCRVSSYISKYLSKSFGVPKGRKRYWYSRSCLRPVEHTYLVTNPDLETLVNDNASYSKHIVNSFDDVRFYEVNEEQINNIDISNYITI